MKTLKTLSFILCITCATTPIYTIEDIACSASAEGQVSFYRGIFTPTDEDLAKLYPGTLIGFRKIDAEVVSVVCAAENNWSTVSPENVKAIRAYYFGKFFAFMNGLRKKNPKETASNEFNALFDNIYQEADEAVHSELTELKWHLVRVMFTRGLLLASGEGSPDAHDFLSGVPDTELFFGALRETPAYLGAPGVPAWKHSAKACLHNFLSGVPDTELFFGALRETPAYLGAPGVPAWKHSAKACLHNMDLDDTKGNDVRKPRLQLGALREGVIGQIEKTANQLGLHQNVYLPMVDCGKVGITTIMKMWLHHAFPVPLTYGEYKAHGISLGAAVGVEHDTAHGNVDNRCREVKQAIIDLLTKVGPTKPVKKAIPLATGHMVARYHAFNEVLLAFIEAKERMAIQELQNAIAIAPEDKTNSDRKAAESLAREKYNTGVAALFQVLHEEYGMKANVLEAPTLAEAIVKLCENAKIRENLENFDELETFFNPASDLSDQEIFEKIKDRALISLEIHPEYDASKPAPVKISDYVDHIDLESLRVVRGSVITEVEFDTNAGQTVRIQKPTTHYMVNTLRDENAVLALVGKKVPDVILDMEPLRALPKDAPARAEALAQVKIWLDAVVANTNEMVTGLIADILESTPVGVAAGYDALVAEQNAEWEAIYPISSFTVAVSVGEEKSEIV